MAFTLCWIIMPVFKTLNVHGQVIVEKVWTIWWSRSKQVPGVWDEVTRLTWELVAESLWRRQWQPHSSTLAWRIPWMEEHGRLQSMGSLRVGHDWVTSLSFFIFMHWRRKWQPTLVFLPGDSQGQRSLLGTVYGVTQSRTRLTWLSSSSSRITNGTQFLKLVVQQSLDTLLLPPLHCFLQKQVAMFKFLVEKNRQCIAPRTLSDSVQFSSVQFGRSVMSGSLWPHGLQHTRPPCPSPTPRACSNSCPLSQWCHPTI